MNFCGYPIEVLFGGGLHTLSEIFCAKNNRIKITIAQPNNGGSPYTFIRTLQFGFAISHDFTKLMCPVYAVDMENVVTLDSFTIIVRDVFDALDDEVLVDALGTFDNHVVKTIEFIINLKKLESHDT